MADINDLTQNVNIWDESKTKAVTVTTDGSKQRLDVNCGEITINDPFKEYSDVSSYSDLLTISNPGTINTIDTYVSYYGENSIVADSLIHTNTPTESILQIVRLSHDNVTGGTFILSLPSSSVSTVVDDFESGVSDWNSSSPEILVSQSTTSSEGNYSMGLQTSRNAKNTYVNRHYSTPQDWSGYSVINFDYRASNTYIRWALEISDGTNTLRSNNFSTNSANTWKSKSIQISSMTEQGSGITDLSAITDIRFVCTRDGYSWSYDNNFFDNLRVEAYSDTTFNFSFYDFGTTAEPTSLSQGSLVQLDNGDTSLSVEVTQSDRHRKIIRGTIGINNPLTKGNYYGILITGTGVGVWGDNSNQSYVSGKTYTVDSSDNLSVIANKSMAFKLDFAPDDLYLTKTILAVDKDPQLTTFTLGKKTNNDLSSLLMGDFLPLLKGNVTFNPDKYLKISRGDIMVLQADHDINSSLEYCSILYKYITKPIVRYN